MSSTAGNPTRLETLIINEEAEAPSLLNPTTGQILITNAVGKRIVELSDGSRNLEEIAQEIVTEFAGVDKEKALRQAEAFLHEGANKGIITWVA